MNNNEYIKKFILKKIESKNDIDLSYLMNDKNNPNLKVACILDVFSYNCFKFEGEFYQLSPYNWKYIIDNYLPSFLFVEAAWEGLDNAWVNKISNYSSSKDNTLEKIINFCKIKKIPTVFWAKEDPYDFNVFINTAKLFEYVFTTDENCISRYRKILNHNNIFLLPFAAQPKLHNPINKDKEKKGQIIFPGGWYHKFPKRCEQMKFLLDGSLNYDLRIYDRFYNSTSKKNEFPNIYKPFIVEGLDYLSLIRELKKYKLLLNANSVDDSPTNFSRRVFESLGCGIPIVSNYALGIDNFFKDIVTLVNNKKETEQKLEDLLSDHYKLDRLSLLGIRAVLNKHTYSHRINTILEAMGMDEKDKDEQGVSVITVTNRSFSLDNILNNYLIQNYKTKELIIIINNNSIDINEWNELTSFRNDIKILKMDEKKSLGECLNLGIEKSSFSYISKFDDDDYYGPNYLVDAINAFKYTDAGIVGKYTVYAYMEGTNELILRYPEHENRYMDYVAGSTLTFKKEIYEKVKFKHKNKSEDTIFLRDCIALGYKIYSSDRFNHVISRRENLSTHTWKISDSEFRRKSVLIKKTLYFKDIVFI